MKKLLVLFLSAVLTLSVFAFSGCNLGPKGPVYSESYVYDAENHFMLIVHSIILLLRRGIGQESVNGYADGACHGDGIGDAFAVFDGLEFVLKLRQDLVAHILTDDAEDHSLIGICQAKQTKSLTAGGSAGGHGGLEIHLEGLDEIDIKLGLLAVNDRNQKL